MRLLNWLLGPKPRFQGSGKLPTRGSEEAAGFDLYSPCSFVLPTLEPIMVPLSITSEFRRDWVAKIWDRSGMGKVGIHILAGVVDSDYRGEWKIILINLTNDERMVQMGDRIAQAVFVPCFTGSARKINKLNETKRGSGGYGSTGR